MHFFTIDLNRVSLIIFLASVPGSGVARPVGRGVLKASHLERVVETVLSPGAQRQDPSQKRAEEVELRRWARGTVGIWAGARCHPSLPKEMAQAASGGLEAPGGARLHQVSPKHLSVLERRDWPVRLEKVAQAPGGHLCGWPRGCGCQGCLPLGYPGPQVPVGLQVACSLGCMGETSAAHSAITACPRRTCQTWCPRWAERSLARAHPSGHLQGCHTVPHLPQAVPHLVAQGSRRAALGPGEGWWVPSTGWLTLGQGGHSPGCTAPGRGQRRLVGEGRPSLGATPVSELGPEAAVSTEALRTGSRWQQLAVGTGHSPELLEPPEQPWAVRPDPVQAPEREPGAGGPQERASTDAWGRGPRR